MDAICATATAKTTVDCYDFWDRAFRRAGMLDYTEGFYDGVPSVPYEQAQQRQIDFLLDQVGCQAGSRILDIGCGNGALLDEVRRRGAAGVGVTISPHQVEYCARRELDVRLLNYRDMGDDLSGRFDAVVANGSMEHFVQPADAAEGRAEAIYREFFEICHRAIDPRSTCRKLINTTIHFGRVRVDPRQAVRSPWSFRWNSDEFHYAFLVREFGGYYPSLGQFGTLRRTALQAGLGARRHAGLPPDERGLAAARQAIHAESETVGADAAVPRAAAAARGRDVVLDAGDAVVELAVPRRDPADEAPLAVVGISGVMRRACFGALPFGSRLTTNAQTAHCPFAYRLPPTAQCISASHVPMPPRKKLNCTFG